MIKQNHKTIIILLFVLLSGVWGVLAQTDTQTNSDAVSAEGQVVPLQSAQLAFSAGGQVKEIFVSVGDVVEAGQPLARLDTADADIALAQAQGQLAQAQAQLQAVQAQLTSAEAGKAVADLGLAAAEANYALTISEPLTQEVQAAELTLIAAQASLSAAEANRSAALNVATDAKVTQAEANVASAIAEVDSLQDQYDDLLKNNILGAPEEAMRARLQVAELNRQSAQEALDALLAGPSTAVRRSANANVLAAQADVANAQAQLDLLRVGATLQQIDQAQNRIDQAAVRITQAENVIVQAEATVGNAELEVEQAETAVVIAEASLNKMSLYAPFDGTIAQFPLVVGELVPSGEAIGRIADFSQWLVQTVDLIERDVVTIDVGLPVRVRIDAIPDVVLSGTISDISSEPEIIRGDVTYQTTVQLEAADDVPLRWGMTAFVTVE